jgi:peroxidase
MRIRTGNHWNNDSTDENFVSADRTDLREQSAPDNFPHSNHANDDPTDGNSLHSGQIDHGRGEGAEIVSNIRTIDGTDNNLTNVDFNATNTDFDRVGAANFADGISTLTEAPSPREISNIVVGQGDADVPNQEGLSGFMYAWGQFIDHDLDLEQSDGINHIDVNIPAGDPSFPDGANIDLTRAVIDPATGAGTDQAATAINTITGWLDASMVYGSDPQTAASLRLPDGHMLTSAGNNLPIVDGAFLAGDVRAQENPSLTALQTLFLREHNYQVDQLHTEHPNWTGDQLYDQAKAITTAEIAHITYSEFLPHLLGPDTLTAYQGYDPNVDPRISEEFAGAAFRFGHSIVSADTERIDNSGNTVGPALDLKDTFFLTASDFTADSGADGFLRHLGDDPSQAMDARIVDDLRNFLVDPPAAIDLASINIQRGHDLGLPTLNEMRTELGLTPYTDFSEITTDQGTVAALKQAFGTVDAIDLWTGGLSEAHVDGGMVGQTFNTIIAHQFEVLRDGDRFFYQNQDFDQHTLNEIQNTTLTDIIERNTDTQVMQSDAFVFTERHSSDEVSETPDAPQLVIGQQGDATLTGGPQNDTLVPAQGNQTLVGMNGDDQFVFNTTGVNATITDFTPGHDKLVFDHILLAEHLGGFQVESDHGNTIVHVAGDTITLDNVQPSQLNQHDWMIS